MNPVQSTIETSNLPLPETQQELELLLEALNALNDTLDLADTEMLVTA